MNTKMRDGKVCVLNEGKRIYLPTDPSEPYSRKSYVDYETRWEPIDEQPTYRNRDTLYVHPIDGLLKVSKAKSYQSIEAERKKVREAETKKVYRDLGNHGEAAFVNGAWYLFKAKPLPPKSVYYTMPVRWATDLEKRAKWTYMTAEEKAKVGDRNERQDRPGEVYVGDAGVHLKHSNTWRYYPKVKLGESYYFEKRLISKADLRRFGLT